MLEDLKAEKKIFKIAIIILLVCYIVAYGYSVWKVEPTEIGSVYDGEPRAFADNRTYKIGEEDSLKSFLQASFSLKLYLYSKNRWCKKII